MVIIICVIETPRTQAHLKAIATELTDELE